jgi:hypothetical protein
MAKITARVCIILHILYFMPLLTPEATAFDDVAVPNTFSSGDTLYHSDLNDNNDTLEVYVNNNADTTDNKFIRFSDMEDGDSTLARAQLDSIRSNPDVDSISGNPVIDSAYFTNGISSGRITTRNSAVDMGTGDITTDSIYGRTIKLNDGAVNTGTGDITTDSVYARTAAIGNYLDFAGNTTIRCTTYTLHTSKAEGGDSAYTVGIAAGQILGWSAFVDQATSIYFPHDMDSATVTAGYEWSMWINYPGNVTSFNIRTHATNSENVIDKDVRVLLWYKAP